jgi:hypothetical protein
MALFNFFNRTKHRRFEYIPRYYNPEKEELEQRLSKYRKENKSEIENVKMNIRAGLRNRAPGNTGFNLRYSLLVMLIVVILLLITVYLLSAYLPRIIEVFGS